MLCPMNRASVDARSLNVELQTGPAKSGSIIMLRSGNSADRWPQVDSTIRSVFPRHFGVRIMNQVLGA